MSVAVAKAVHAGRLLVSVLVGWPLRPHHVLLACRLGLLAGQTFIWYVMVSARCFGWVAEL
jgi:hypothetical protein